MGRRDDCGDDNKKHQKRGILNKTAVFSVVGVLGGLAALYFIIAASVNFYAYSKLRANQASFLDPVIFPMRNSRNIEYLFNVYLGSLAIIFAVISACKLFAEAYKYRKNHLNILSFVCAVGFLLLLGIGLAILTNGTEAQGVYIAGWFAFFATIVGVFAAYYCEVTWYRMLLWLAATFAAAVSLYSLLTPPHLAWLFVNK